MFEQEKSEVKPVRRYLDNTILAGYKKCPRYYFLRHKKNWRREGTSPALAFGLSWHTAQDVIWQHHNNLSLAELVRMAAAMFEHTWEEQGLPVEMTVEQVDQFNPRTPSVAREMLVAYLKEREHILTNSKLLACEQPFAVPLPLDNSSDLNVWYAGRLDKVIEYNGSKLIIEHKTTSEYAKASGFKTGYVTGWYLDSQVMGYLYGGALYFPGVEQVWVDAALVHKAVHDKYRFIPIGHQWGMLEAWVQDTKEWARRLVSDEMRFADQGKLEGGVFPKQQDSCIGRYGPCQMLDICRTQANPEKLEIPPEGYVEEPWSPFDILKLNKLLAHDTSQV